MDYEKKYKAALERAKECLKDGTITTIARDYIWEIFPELKDSEDEKIRKSLIKAFGTIGKKNWGGLIVRDILAWLEKQGNKSVNIDIESIISSYKQRLKSQGSIENTPLFDICLTAFRHGVENVLEELNLKALDPDKVIEWLKAKVYDDSTYGMAMIDKFKKDFGL